MVKRFGIICCVQETITTIGHMIEYFRFKVFMKLEIQFIANQYEVSLS